MTRYSMGMGALLFAAIGMLSVLAAHTPTSDEHVARLPSDAERLQATLHKCRLLISPAQNPVCAAASEAWRHRFFDGPEVASVAGASKASTSAERHAASPIDVPTEPQPWVFGP